jgi:hypothetical protein
MHGYKPVSETQGVAVYGAVLSGRDIDKRIKGRGFLSQRDMHKRTEGRGLLSERDTLVRTQ